MSSPKPRTSKFFNSNLTTTLSITLVLFVVGIITLLTLTGRKATAYVRENLGFTIVLENDSNEIAKTKLLNRLKLAVYVKEFNYITKEQAIKELIAELGEDPEKFLGYNPLHASIEVKLNSNYVNTESMQKIEKELASYTNVKEIVYQKNVMDIVNGNIQQLSIFLAGIALLLLFISIGLINNTIRLQIYSKRFLINTMRLVGATAWFIRKPFLARGLRNGFVASILSSAILSGILYYFYYRYDFPMEQWIGWQELAITVGVIIVVGELISFFSSLFAVRKYLRIKTNDLYYI